MSLVFHFISGLVFDYFGTTGLAQPRPSTVITSQNIDSSHLSGLSASALRTSLDTPSTERRYDLGGSIYFSPYILLHEDQIITSYPVSDSLHHRPSTTEPCTPIITLSLDDLHQSPLHRIVPRREDKSNNDLLSHHTPSHVILCDEKRSIARKHQITLMTYKRRSRVLFLLGCANVTIVPRHSILNRCSRSRFSHCHPAPG